jgi:hypothetical protein
MDGKKGQEEYMEGPFFSEICGERERSVKEN